MIVFDSTFLVDYLNEDPATAAFLETHDGKPFFAPTLALLEAYRGAVRTAGPDGVERVTTALEWLEPVDLTDAAAREAAMIESELLADGAPINLGDVLIAGVCRHNGACLVTRNGDFENVDGLETLRY